MGGFFIIWTPRISELETAIHNCPRLLAYGAIGRTDDPSALEPLRSPKSDLLTAMVQKQNLRSIGIQNGAQ
jgi:hypothetical protein